MRGLQSSCWVEEDLVARTCPAHRHGLGLDAGDNAPPPDVILVHVHRLTNLWKTRGEESQHTIKGL